MTSPIKVGRLRSNALNAVATRVWLLIIGVAFVAFAFWAMGTRKQEHHIRAAFNSAVLVVPGLDVKVNGVIVGKTGSVKSQDGKALVEIGLADDQYWPLHQGTRALLRFGTTIGNGTRYVELRPGPASGAPLSDGSVLPETRTTTPVEFDQIFNTLGSRTRADAQQLLRNTAAGLDGNEAALNAGFRRLPGATGAASDLLGDLASDDAALAGMVINTNRVTRTLAARAPAVGDLVSVAAATFGRFAQNASSLQATIDRSPEMLDRTRSTLAHLDRSVGEDLTPLVKALAPGARRVPAVAASAASALRQIRTVTPSALSTLSALRSASPGLTRMANAGTPLLGTAGRDFSALAPMLACIRPYAPELGGLFIGWGSMTKNYTLNHSHGTNKDGPRSSHYGRVKGDAGPASLMDFPAGVNGSELITKVPGVRYAFPMPPGYLAGKPTFNESCGYGKDSLDPSKDPENQKR